MLLNLVFANNAILSCFFSFFLIIDLYFLTPAVTAQMFNPNAEQPTPSGTTFKEGNAEMVTHQVTAEAKISKCSI